jgi:hypothetical protein
MSLLRRFRRERDARETAELADGFRQAKKDPPEKGHPELYRALRIREFHRELHKRGP